MLPTTLVLAVSLIGMAGCCQHGVCFFDTAKDLLPRGGDIDTVVAGIPESTQTTGQ